MTNRATADANKASKHEYAGLEKADTNRATWFDFREVDDTEDFDSDTDWFDTHKRSYYKHLDHHHRGYVNGVWRNSAFYTYQSNLHLSEALSGRLGLTAKQRSEAEKWFRLLHLEKLGPPAEVSGFSICARIVHEADYDDRECHPATPKEKWPPEFREEFQSFRNKHQAIYHKIYGRIDHQIRNWSYQRDSPASERMDRYNSYEAQLRYSSESSTEGGGGIYTLSHSV